MKKTRLGKSIRVGSFNITPVESIDSIINAGQFGVSVVVDYKPLGIVVESAGTRWALAVDGHVCHLKDLLPGIDDSE